mgnify:CR=1 FL=1
MNNTKYNWNYLGYYTSYISTYLQAFVHFLVNCGSVTVASIGLGKMVALGWTCAQRISTAQQNYIEIQNKMSNMGSQGAAEALAEFHKMYPSSTPELEDQQPLAVGDQNLTIEEIRSGSKKKKKKKKKSKKSSKKKTKRR